MSAVDPNPMVGCVIVYNFRIIGEGWHQKYGGSHAEVNAINSVENKELLKESTLYVSLEPCAHFGKTPPCTSLVIRYKVPRVVIGSIDSFGGVNGRGIKKLKEAGIDVKMSVLESECRELNKRFFTYHQRHKPYVILKYAISKDGFLDKFRTVNDVSQARANKISNEYSIQLVHKYRAQESAILVGTNTVLNDNPKLDVRYWFGRPPVRVVFDRYLKIPKHYQVYNEKVKTIFFTSLRRESYREIIFETVDFSNVNVLGIILNKLYLHGIQSLIVEGGAKVLHSFVSQGLWDIAKVFIADIRYYDGISPPFIPMNFKTDEISVGEDVLCYYKRSGG